ncbi:MAG: hypothetical protein LBS84_13725 [Clostridiales bacterium]|nr:hypothetical protein [Clostridiales bacterium]
MRIYNTVQTETQEVESVTCNKCGKPIKKEPYGYWDTFISVEKTWAYGTEWDGETHSFDLCEHCYRELIAQFAVPVTRSE